MLNVKQYVSRSVTGPEGSRRLRLPDFEKNGIGKW
jgi:hypothetical protein